MMAADERVTFKRRLDRQRHDMSVKVSAFVPHHVLIKWFLSSQFTLKIVNLFLIFLVMKLS